ncbi:MAG: phosphoglucosamine mutase [Bryobacteraceae bacterium]
MAKKLFGTDGIRGVAGEPPLDARTAHALGVALGQWARVAAGGETTEAPEIIVGMDTRESGPWLVGQIAGGLKRSRVRTRFAGVITTPGVAYLARTGHFIAGVMVSASHNPYHDNGIKVINHAGYKLADSLEEELEGQMFQWLDSTDEAVADSVPRDASLDTIYSDYLASTVHGDLPFHLAVDCANGSATAMAPELFRRLGARIELIGNEPDGRNINLNCGSLHLESLQKLVLETGADLGVAFDGDADRALFVSRDGKVVDGDAILYIAGAALNASGHLPGDIVIATVMSNLGLEKALERHGISLVRTPVGDKYVLEEMLKRGATLGGEQSGHVIFSEYATTGDGILTALRVLEIMRHSELSLNELASAVKTFPQKLVNVRVKSRKPLDMLDHVQHEIRAAEDEFQSSGRVVVRFSGTEPLARVMVEAESDEQVEKWTSRIAHAIRQELGALD